MVDATIAAATPSHAEPVEEAAASYEPDGRLVVLASGIAGLEAASAVVADYPANCPPTVVLIDAEAEAVAEAFDGLRSTAKCNVADAAEGAELKPGTVHLAHDRARHVIVEAGSPPRLRMADRDPVAGFRPSADLLLGSIARAKIPAVSGLLCGTGTDGSKGLQILTQTGARVFIQRPEDFVPRDRYDAVRALGLDAAELATDAVAEWVLEQTAKA